MKIEVGEFVRTDEGYISKETDRNFIKMLLEGKSSFGKPAKHSKQLIDLIEQGDYVNGRKVERIGDYEDFKRIDFEPYEDYIYEYDIKTILTHEQFEQNCYRVEE